MVVAILRRSAASGSQRFPQAGGSGSAFTMPGNPTPPSMLTLRSLTLRSKGHLSVPGREAGWRMFLLVPGYYKVPLNSTLGFLRNVEMAGSLSEVRSR